MKRILCKQSHRNFKRRTLMYKCYFGFKCKSTALQHAGTTHSYCLAAVT